MIDPTRLRELEERLEPWKIVGSTPEVRILGYGEISTVLAFEGDERMAYKRMPLFSNAAQACAYVGSYQGYTKLLREAGLELPEDQTAIVEIPNRAVVLCIAQCRIPPERFCSALIQRLDAAACRGLLDMVVERISRIWSFNAGRCGVELAIDGQLSNWALLEGERLVFVDTSTPMFRADGREQLDPELFIASAPAFLRWFLRLAFLHEVMNRYYDPRRVFMDLTANL